jgi:hypothetical protein
MDNYTYCIIISLRVNMLLIYEDRKDVADKIAVTAKNLFKDCENAIVVKTILTEFN